MSNGNAITADETPGLSPAHQNALDVVAQTGRGTRWTKAAINFMATAITSAVGGPASFLVGMVGAGVTGIAGLWTDKKQDTTNELFSACITEMGETIAELRSTVSQVILSIDATDDHFADRMEDGRYQQLIRKAFSSWSRGESQEKREMIRRLLSHAAEMPDPDYDLFNLFFDWLSRYNELHFRLIRSLKEQGNPTRLQIWEGMGGTRVRDDSADADVFGCLIKDLTFGHVLRIAREKSSSGAFLKRARTRSKQASPYMKSVLDNKDPMELTAVGELFIHYAMSELVDKIGSS